MKVKVENPYTLIEIKSKLEEHFPEYKMSFRGTKMLIIAETNFVGASILGEKKGFIRIIEGFPTIGAQMLFVLSIFLFGILIPFLIWHFTVLRKQKLVRDKVSEFLRQEYSNEVFSSSQEVLD
ncbi:hypothetical protein [Parvicella tangerina]|uniref:Uncharacterized protein n=1 Tax=Parvicella tangerina TaxID=2829795 RepID=A0A916JKX6_9FLAO|nr:hypothetical protein [Parvicella tangerina]CAG5078432.1 hypothetical protein CRYO30217_00669 [Parvicella tangerina]